METQEATPQVTQAEAIEQVTEEAQEPVSEEENQETPPVEVSPKDDPTERRWEMMLKKDRELRQLQMELKRQQEQFGQSNQSLKEVAKRNPVKALEELGLSYQDVTNYILNGEQQKEDPNHQVLNEVKEVKSWIEQQREREAKQAYEAEINSFKETIGDYVKTSENKLGLLAALPNASDLVYDVIEGQHQNTGNILSIDEATRYVENSFEEQLSSFLETKKGKELARKLLGVVDEGKPQEPIAKDVKKASVTLTNSATSQGAPGQPRKMSNEESIAAAAKLLQWND